ncbi:MAG TPA: AIM24 family protein [Streptosporangiaceae bacterium]|nr:AIM24 family protein [Streptosporangiaceae bacterium]
MREQIHAAAMPVLSIHLEPGESVVAEVGEFSWMTDAIQMSTGAGAAKPGQRLVGALTPVTGASPPPMSTYTAQGGPGTISFAAKVPGSILPVDVGPGAGYLVHRHGFLAGTPGIEISVGFQRSFRAGIFADKGFVLHRLGGHGRAWAELSGQVVPHELAAGESLRVLPGHVGMFQVSVSFQVVRVPGITNRYFGGDAHYFAELSGPGTVWLQSAPLPQLAASIVSYLPDAAGRPEPVEGGLVGGILGDLLT